MFWALPPSRPLSLGPPSATVNYSDIHVYVWPLLLGGPSWDGGNWAALESRYSEADIGAGSLPHQRAVRLPSPQINGWFDHSPWVSCPWWIGMQDRWKVKYRLAKTMALTWHRGHCKCQGGNFVHCFKIFEKKNTTKCVSMHCQNPLNVYHRG